MKDQVLFGLVVNLGLGEDSLTFGNLRVSEFARIIFRLYKNQKGLRTDKRHPDDEFRVELIESGIERLTIENGQVPSVTHVVAEISDSIVSYFCSGRGRSITSGGEELNREKRLSIAVQIENILMDSWYSLKGGKSEVVGDSQISNQKPIRINHNISKQVLAQSLLNRIKSLNEENKKGGRFQEASNERISELRGLCIGFLGLDPFFSILDLAEVAKGK